MIEMTQSSFIIIVMGARASLLLLKRLEPHQLLISFSFLRYLKEVGAFCHRRAAMSYGVLIVGFDGDDLYTTKVTPIVKHLSDHCGEPIPKRIFAATSSDSGKTIQLLSDHSPGLHKVMLMDEDSKK
jgi:hypothetical protein